MELSAQPLIEVIVMNEPARGELNFETAFARLEQILEKMNLGATSLDESLKLYEEANQLITLCSKQLTDAEGRIEALTKNKNGEIMLGADQKPLTQEFPGK